MGKRTTLAIESSPVVLCAGKDCRQRSEYARLHQALLDLGDEAVTMDCAGICSGPVVVVGVAAKRPVVLSKLRTDKQRRHLLRLTTDGGEPSATLSKRVVKGAKRKKAIKAARRAVA